MSTNSNTHASNALPSNNVLKTANAQPTQVQQPSSPFHSYQKPTTRSAKYNTAFNERSSPAMGQRKNMLLKQTRTAQTGDDTGYYADEDSNEDASDSDSEDENDDSDSSISSEGPPRSTFPDRSPNRCRHASSRTFMYVGDCEAFSQSDAPGTGSNFTSSEEDGSTDK